MADARGGTAASPISLQPRAKFYRAVKIQSKRTDRLRTISWSELWMFSASEQAPESPMVLPVPWQVRE